MTNENHYSLVTTVQGIRNYLKCHKIVAFDLEASPKKEFRTEERAALDSHKSTITGCSFSIEEGTGIYVPIAHIMGPNVDKKEFMEFFSEFLTDKTITKVAHNIAYESSQVYNIGIIIKEPVYDTICASQMTLKNNFEYRKLSDSGLKKLAGELCGVPLPSFSSVTNGKHFDELDPTDPETIRYGCADSDFALRLYHIFNDWFDRYQPSHRFIVERLESPTAVYIGIMKHNGVPIDANLLAEKTAHADAEMKRLADAIHFIIGDVNIGSNCNTKEFKEYLYKTQRLPVVKTTATDREAADDQTMVMLKEYCDAHRPELSVLFSLVQEYRKWSKIKTTYLDGYKKYINSVTGRIHPEMLALSTETGRFSCSKPNCQNMPRKTNDPIGIRSLVCAGDGYKIISCDFSQIELRVGAFYCRDEVMLDTYRKNGDIHAATTSVVFSIPYEQAKDKNAEGYKERRTISKNVNFGVFYGLFPKGLQGTLKFKAGVEKTIEECEEIIANLKAGYPALVSWQEETKAEAYIRMYTETWLGRRRYLPGIRSEDWGKKSFAERCSMNTPIQGTAADILKLAIGRILEGLCEHPYLKPILQIHDELTFLVPDDKVAEAVAFIKECMEEQPFPDFDLPLIAEASVGTTFGNMEELD